MFNDRISAAAGGTPTRRLALASLAGLGAALSLPVPAKAAIASDHPDAALLARAAEVDAVNARCRAAYKRQSLAEELKLGGDPSPDFTAATAEHAAAEDAWFALYRELVDMPASTIAGLQIKVRVCDGDPELSQEMMASIGADILAMGEGGA